ncbi:MAG TPA: sensor domain-containing phosphodiesterase [Oleiagrimonas sp.]|nr:sensor domain-containing phosphodiesterase [Oleiagrimonas sp.]
MNALATPASAGILLVTPQRDDRRALFNVLDSHGFSTIYAARDVAQAQTLLTEHPQVDLVLMEFCGEAGETLAFCTQLHNMSEYGQVQVLGLLSRHPAHRVWDHDNNPPGVAGWLQTPVDADAALELVRKTLDQPSRIPDPAALTSVSGKGNYRFAFEDDDREWIISTLEGAVLEVNPAFVGHTGIDAESACSRSLATLLGEGGQTPESMKESLGQSGSLERIVRRPRQDGRQDLMRAMTRMAMRDGQIVHVTSLQHHGPVARARTMLNLLARLHVAGSGDTGMREAVRLLMAALPLDFVGIYAALPESSGEPETRVQEFSKSLTLSGAIPEVLQQPVLKLVLDGDTLIHSSDAHRLAGSDEFVSAMGFTAFAGLPLVDERKNVLGALLAGSRQAWDSHALVPETLRAAGIRFAFDMELERARQQGRDHGLLDGLTHLPNRLLFNDRLDTVLREAHRTGETFAVLFVDLDRFKSINDSLGHSVGDEVLVAVARRLRGSVRSSDTVARYAGDEFTIILRHIIQRDDVLRIADKIVRLMDTPLMLADGSELHITASLGISFYPDDATTAERLLKYADVAMYNAKGRGRNGYQVYVSAPDKSHEQRVALESKLRQAEKNGELRLHYQPQVDAHSEDIVGMEALVRWEHPELGMISPGFFIPLAEETGLIISIGEWVLRTACEATARWHKRYGLPLRIGVNLSAMQLMQPNLTELVRSALQESGLAADSLELEVTESISVKSVPGLLENLNALHDLGCRLAIDDFGTGQSSLDYLRNLPADRIKIDQSFVRNIGVDPDDETIVKATIDMAHSLNRAVVAEGVETEAHLDFLREHSCDELQGYLFCRPLDRNAFDAMLAERQRLMSRKDSSA